MDKESKTKGGKRKRGGRERVCECVCVRERERVIYTNEVT
jgi:hypothetical protein